MEKLQVRECVHDGLLEDPKAREELRQRLRDRLYRTLGSHIADGDHWTVLVKPEVAVEPSRDWPYHTVLSLTALVRKVTEVQR